MNSTPIAHPATPPACDSHEHAAAAAARAYRGILRSSALIGSATLVTLGAGIVRTKVLAVLLGPSGFGLASLYASILDLAAAVAAMGVNGSGVRQIAEAAGTGERARIAVTAAVLRRTGLALGACGALALACFAAPVAELTFDSDEYAGAVRLLALAVFCRVVADSRTALLQGMRRIGDLARANVIGAVVGALASILLVRAFGVAGIAAALVAAALAGLAVAHAFARRVPIETARLTTDRFRAEAAALLTLGSAFMASGLLMLGAAYAVRLTVLRELGTEAAGLYQAAWTLGGLYVGIVLQAMGADFYPRLCGVIADAAACNRVVNEQTRVSLLLAGPGVIGTLTLAPLVVALLYSEAFAGAVEALRWICMGIALRVITWPVGYVVVARGERSTFFATELAWAIANVALTAYCVTRFGLSGAGIAFFGSYVFHLLVIYPIVRRMTGFRWAADNLATGAAFLATIGLVFVALRTLPAPAATAVGLAACALSAMHAIRRLVRLAGTDVLPTPVVALLRRARLVG